MKHSRRVPVSMMFGVASVAVAAGVVFSFGSPTTPANAQAGSANGGLTLSVQQLTINQRISSAAVRRSNQNARDIKTTNAELANVRASIPTTGAAGSAGPKGDTGETGAPGPAGIATFSVRKDFGCPATAGTLVDFGSPLGTLSFYCDTTELEVRHNINIAAGQKNVFQGGTVLKRDATLVTLTKSAPGDSTSAAVKFLTWTGEGTNDVRVSADIMVICPRDGLSCTVDVVGWRTPAN